MNEEIKIKILALLGGHRIMTIATLRPDGWPQATTVGYATEGLTIYFLCGLHSQKASNIAHAIARLESWETRLPPCPARRDGPPHASSWSRPTQGACPA